MQWPVLLNAGEISVQFDRWGDRIGHAIVVSDTQTPVLISLEGNPHEPWPPSPPFQELTIETRDNRQIALLVGRAGTSHWSASVEPCAEKNQIAFDVACRIQLRPDWLGSRMTIDFRGDYPLEVVGSTEIDSASERRMRNNCIEVFPSAAPARLPATVRWRYIVTGGLIAAR